MTTKTFVCTSIKGGVRKTTDTVELALGLAQTGRRVLVIDTDHQCNATLALTNEMTERKEGTFHEVMMDRRPVKDVIQQTKFPNLDLVEGSMWLSNANTKLASQYGRENILRNALEGVTGYHYILMDTAPNTELITVNAWVASDGLIINLTPSKWAMVGIRILEIHLDEIRQQTKREYPIFGVIVGKYEHTNLHNTRLDQIREYYPDKIFKTVIPKNVRVEEATDNAIPIFDYAPGSTGAIAYADLVQEFILRSESEGTNNG
jgi:ATPases involved in chromosome partitioning